MEKMLIFDLGLLGCPSPRLLQPAGATHGLVLRKRLLVMSCHRVSLGVEWIGFAFFFFTFLKGNKYTLCCMVIICCLCTWYCCCFAVFDKQLMAGGLIDAKGFVLRSESCHVCKI